MKTGKPTIENTDSFLSQTIASNRVLYDTLASAMKQQVGSAQECERVS
jgi:hypothetical protein